MLFYFLTIDKCDTSGGTPKREEYEEILNSWKNVKRGVAHVECYEYKTKQILGMPTRWLHYHAIVKSSKMIIYKKVQKKGYSIRFNYLKTKEDVFNTAAYIIKQKHDEAECNIDELRTIVSNESQIDTGY